VVRAAWSAAVNFVALRMTFTYKLPTASLPTVTLTAIASRLPVVSRRLSV